MTSIELTTPAKVNLFLKVFNKRKDSYHNILTLFEKISLSDNITISKVHKGIIVSSDKFITSDPKDNLAYKAAELMLKTKKIKSGVKIRIKKRIPIGAGLGGGSSDAASVLKGMNRLFGLSLKKEELMRLGRRLGADVPFFLFGAPFAIGRSKGDRLERVSFKKRLWHLIIYPGFRLSTKSVYEAFDFGLTRKFDDVKINLPLTDRTDFSTLRSMLHNDLEEIAVAKEAVIGRIIERLVSSLCQKAIVSGSGPSVFCLYRSRKEAMRDKIRLLRSVPVKESRAWQVFIAGTEA